MKMYSLSQYRNKCVGCNACVEIAPGRWRMSTKDGKATLINGKAKKDIYTVMIHSDELIPSKMAAERCPVNIIKLNPISVK